MSSITYSCVKCGKELKPKEICTSCFPNNSSTQPNLDNDQIEFIRFLYESTVSKMMNSSHKYTSDDVRKLKRDVKLRFPHHYKQIIHK